MHVAVNHRGTLDAVRLARPLNGHCQIVEHTEPRTLRPKRVMRAACKRTSNAVGQSRLRGRKSSTRAAQRPFHKFKRPGEADAPHDLTVESTLQKTLNVSRIVNAQQVCFSNKGRWLNAKPLVGRKRLAQEPVLRQGEFVARRKRKGLMISVEEVYRRGQVLG